MGATVMFFTLGPEVTMFFTLLVVQFEDVIDDNLSHINYTHFATLVPD